MTKPNRWKLFTLGLIGTLTLSLGLAGCAPSRSASTGIRVVASTNVWGNIAGLIGGDSVTVSSLITDPKQDPHDYQASATNLKTVSDAQLLIENGGGYDDFMTQLIESSGNKAAVVNAVKISGFSGDDLNEHVWYSFPTVKLVAASIANELSLLDPSDAEVFSKNLDNFNQQLDQLTAAATALNASSDRVLVTEPVPLYLLEAAGFSDATPHEFSHAVEEGNDAPASVVSEMNSLLQSGTIRLLAVNSQTESEQVDAVRDVANKANVPVVEFTETLPAGLDYLSWMRQNIQRISEALEQPQPSPSPSPTTQQ